MGTTRLAAILIAAGMLATACGGGTATPQAQAPATSQAPTATTVPSQPSAPTSTTVPPTVAPSMTAAPAPTATTPAKPAATATSPAKPAVTATPAAGASNLAACGTDLACFIEASRAGRPAKVDYTVSLDFFGMFVANTDTLAINGKEGSNLLFSQRTTAADATVTEDMLKLLQSRGITEANAPTLFNSPKILTDIIPATNATLSPDMMSKLKGSRDAQASRIGTGQDCKVPQAALTATLEKWQQGEYSTSDFDAAECTAVGGDADTTTSSTSSAATPTKPAGTATRTPVPTRTAVPTRTVVPTRTATPARTATPGAQATGSLLGRNLIVNGDAETGPSATNTMDAFAPSGWNVTGNFTVIKYGTTGVLATTAPGPTNRGASFFAGGPNNDSSSASQTINVSTLARDIDAGRIRFTLSAYMGGKGAESDSAMFTASFRDANGEEVGSAILGPTIPETRGEQDGLKQPTMTQVLPKNTRSIEVIVDMKRYEGDYSDGYVDNLELILRGGPTG